jgi:hypothetical protein
MFCLTSFSFSGETPDGGDRHPGNFFTGFSDQPA